MFLEIGTLNYYSLSLDFSNFSFVFSVPGLTIATDIICGFPTETETDFIDTMTLCEKYKFPSLFINQFFPRPGTPAANMERIPGNLVKIRTKKLTDLFNSYEPYAHKIGEIQTVLVTEISHDKLHYVGHNKYYEQVLLPMNDNLLGKSIQVRIVAASKFSMSAEIVDHDETKWKHCSTKVMTKGRLAEGLSTNCAEYTDTNGLISNNDDKVTNIYLYYGLIALGLAIVYRFIWKLLQDV